MARATIDRLIVNSPYEEPAEHWRYDRARRGCLTCVGRAASSRLRCGVDATPRSFDDPGVFRSEIPLVNRIRAAGEGLARERGIQALRESPSVSWRYWTDPEEFARRRFFFCQLEAVETLIWLAEAPVAEKVGVEHTV